MSKEWNVSVITQFIRETKVIADDYEMAQQKAQLLLEDEYELPSIMNDEPDTFVEVEKDFVSTRKDNNTLLQVKAKLHDEIYALFKETKHGSLCEFDFTDQIIEILCKYESKQGCETIQKSSYN